jgi:hypothetical protein
VPATDKKLSRDKACPRSARKTSMSKKAFFLPAEAFPANNPLFVRRREKRVVMIHFAVAFFTANGGFAGYFRVDRFDHAGFSSV